MRIILLVLVECTKLLMGVPKQIHVNNLDQPNELTNSIEDDCVEEADDNIPLLCHEKKEILCSVCHTMYIKECHVNMEPKNTPIKMNMCRSVQADQDCKNGYRRSCRTWYESECGTRWRFEEIEEDRPVCGVQMVGRCQENAVKGEDDDISGCVEVPVMKCRIQKRRVRKRIPKTACRRIPRQFCIKKKCKRKKRKCQEKIQIISELSPVESCSYTPKKVCQETMAPGRGCRTIKKKVCKPATHPQNRKNCGKIKQTYNQDQI